VERKLSLIQRELGQEALESEYSPGDQVVVVYVDAAYCNSFCSENQKSQISEFTIVTASGDMVSAFAPLPSAMGYAHVLGVNLDSMMAPSLST
jgi:hypothetical protein